MKIWRSPRVLLLVAALATIAWDMTRAPADQVGARVAVSAIHAYQRHLSPWLGRAGVECRFTLSCSRYAETVIARDGLAQGGVRAVARVLRCGPWTPPGTVDPP